MQMGRVDRQPETGPSEMDCRAKHQYPIGRLVKHVRHT